MNRKNLLLTMLACLNCVHTTHAVEKIGNTNIKQADQEGSHKLRMQYLLQALRVDSPGGSVIKKKDASIKHMKILHNMIQETAQPHMDDKQVRLMVDILGKVPGELEALDLSAFEDDRRADTVETVIKSLANEEDILLPFWDYYTPGDASKLNVNGSIYDRRPGLNPKIMNDNTLKYKDIFHIRNGAYEVNQVHEYIEELKKIDPNMETQALDVFTQYWRNSLNEQILDIGNWQPDLEFAIVPHTREKLDQLKDKCVSDTLCLFREAIQPQAGTDTQKAFRETMLNEITDNLLGDDQDIDTKTDALVRRDWCIQQRHDQYVNHNRPWNNLKQATHTLLEKDPELAEMVFTRIRQTEPQPRIQLVHAFAKAANNNEGDRPLIKKVILIPKLIFERAVVKYL